MTTRLPLPATPPAPALPLRRVPSVRNPAAPDAGPVVPSRSRLRVARAAVALATVASTTAAVVGAIAYGAAFEVEGADPRGPFAPLGSPRVSGAAVDRLKDTGSWAEAAAVASAVAVCLAFVVVLRWQNVVLRNQRALGIARPRYGPWRAGLAWVIPIWSLFGPKRAYDDVWRAAAPSGLPVEPERGTDREKVPLVFTVWWGSWITAGVLAVFASRTPLGTLGDRLTLQGLHTASSASLAVSGACFVSVMTRIAARHEAAADEAGG